MALSDNARSILLMNVAMATFTLNDTAMKKVMETLPLYQAIGLRGILCTLALVLIALRGRALVLSFPRADGRALFWRTLTDAGGTLTYLVALNHMPLANIQAIMQAVPLVVTLGAALGFGEAFGWRRAVAIGIGFVGVLVIVRPGPDGFDLWSLLGIASVLLVVARDLFTRKLTSGVPSLTVAVAAAAGVGAMGLAGAAVEGWQPVGGFEAALIVVAAAFLVVGYFTVVATVRVGHIGAVAPFRYMALLWAIVLGWLVFDQFPDALTLAGAGLVVGSGIFTLLREARMRSAGGGG